MDILLVGAYGKMGQVVADYVKTLDENITLWGFDRSGGRGNGIKVFNYIDDINITPHVILDFSAPAVCETITAYATANAIPYVSAVTGLTEKETLHLQKAAQSIPVLHSSNFSMGIGAITEILKLAARLLGESFDIEIIEAHHNRKVDAPSGTAYILADAVKEELSSPKKYVYDRHSLHNPRQKSEIGIHSIRGGTIVGEHSVIFAGESETVTITHTAQSRTIFAVGAINACKFLMGKPAGMYSMQNVIDSFKNI